MCPSNWQQNAWLSVEMPRNSPVDYIAVYNRVDNPTWASWLNPFEVWVGGSAGDMSACTRRMSARSSCATCVEAPPMSIVLLVIASMKDAALFLRDNAALFVDKTKEVVVMGGVTPFAEGAAADGDAELELVPDSANNNTFFNQGFVS